jgi:hypothetical protein
MIKVKHARTADCVVAGFRWHKSGDDRIGSLLLGLYDERGTLHHVGVTSAFTMEMRKQLALELAPLREHALADHPWREWAEAGAGEFARMPGGQSRWRRAGSGGSRCDRARAKSSTTTCRTAPVPARGGFPVAPDKPPRDRRYDRRGDYALRLTTSSAAASSGSTLPEAAQVHRDVLVTRMRVQV